MLRRFAGSCLLVFLLPAVVGAQVAGQGGVAQDVERLKQDVKQLREDLSKLGTNVTTLTTTVAENHTLVNELKDKHEQDIAKLAADLNQQLELQQALLDQISTSDSSGQRIPRLSANMERSAEFRQDVYDAVHNSIAKQGDFSIVNKTSSYQRIHVNRQEYGVSAGQTLTLKVPVGTVTTQLPGQELKNWTLSAPDYQENIEVVPTSQPTVVYRPTTTYSPTTVYSPSVYSPTTVYSPPVYVEPTYYYYSTYYDPYWYWPY